MRRLMRFGHGIRLFFRALWKAPRAQVRVEDGEEVVLETELRRGMKGS